MNPSNTTLRPDLDRNASTVVLRAMGLKKSFGGQVVLEDVNFDLHEGEIVLLRGENGSGKTTLLNLLTGILEPDSGTLDIQLGKRRETFRFPRHWWNQVNPFDHYTPEKVANEGLVRSWQDVRLFAQHTLETNIAVASPKQPGENPWLSLSGTPKVGRFEAKNLQATDQMLNHFGLGERRLSMAAQLSLGQSKRLAIARALRADGKILLLDEPLSGLDVSGMDSVADLLHSLAVKERIAIVIVEHAFNVNRIAEIAHSIWTLHNGKTICQSRSEWQSSKPDSLKGGVSGLLASHLHQSTGRKTIQFPGNAVLTIFQRQLEHARMDKPFLRVNGLKMSRGSRALFGSRGGKDGGEVSFELYEGDVALLEAPNGWGKTSFIEALFGLLPIQAGEVQLEGRNISNLPVWSRSHMGLSYLPARNAGFGSLTVAEQLLLSNDSSGEHLKSLLTRQIDSLSGGELRRVSIACLSPRPKVALLDEPFIALDEKNILSEETLKLIQSSREGVTLITAPSSIH